MVGGGGGLSLQVPFEVELMIEIVDSALFQRLLTWTEHGIPNAAHQVHIVQVQADRIVAHQVWCGGRWAADLMAEMEEASA